MASPRSGHALAIIPEKIRSFELANKKQPASDKEIYGDYLINAQGEDVVAGIRTPRPLKELRTDMPELYKQLQQMNSTL